MKATDLRVNNLVQHKDRLIEICGTTDAGIYVYSDSMHGSTYFYLIEEIEPVELKEEWLLKMGFEKDGKYYSKGSFHYHEFGHVFIGNDHVSSGNVDSHIKYIHELQNLYYALKKEELTIK